MTVTVQHDVLTMEEAARILRCSKAHLSNVLRGKVPSLPPLPHVSLGRRTLIRRAVLQQWLERLEESGEPEVRS
jgi:excisionase family DNA binding protein